jgi:DNA-binding GntR family transcriptional regulator
VLERHIIEGKLGPGARLAEEQIAKELAVSRSPVREAVAQLQRAGLAERSGFHDRRVFVPTKKFVSELFDLWVILESTQVYFSSLRASRDDMDAIAGLLARMRASLASKKRYAQLSRSFSALLKKGCDNRLLNDVVNGQEKYLRWLESMYYRDEPQSLRQTHDDHLLIFRQFRRRDLKGLVSSIGPHVNRQREKVLRTVTKSALGKAGNVPGRRPAALKLSAAATR